jgi:hypothetical protein
MWRVDVPKGPVGRVRANFRTKEKAELFLKACKKELKRTKKVSFLTSSHRLFDAIEASRLLEAVGGPWQNKLRRAAALYALCCEEEQARTGEMTRSGTPEKSHDGRAAKRPKPYSPPQSRGIEIHPGLFKALDRIAREKGVDLNDIVAGLVWKFVQEESEKLAKRHEYPNEEKVRLRDVLF